MQRNLVERQAAVTKAAVTKQVLEMQKFFNLSPRKAQRGEAARNNMRKSRNAQLNK